MGIGTPEANLWASVLHSAMLEGFFGCPGGHYATLAANSQAITFLVSERGEWADSRRRICTFLGIEDAVRRNRYEEPGGGERGERGPLPAQLAARLGEEHERAQE